jgi:type II secretory pathway pseudopilin PulG
MYSKLIKSSANGFSFLELLLVTVLVSMAFVIFIGSLTTNKQVNAQTRVNTLQGIMMNDLQEQIRSRRFDQSTDGSWSNNLGPDQSEDYMLQFDGNDDVYFGNNSSLNIRNNTTVMAWVKPNTYSGRQEIMTNDDVWYWEIRSNGNLNFERHGGSQVNCNNCLTHNEWQHIAIIRNGSNLHMYINAQAVASSGVSGTFNNISYGYYIGQHGHDNSLHYSGAIDEVSVWNTALTQAEIQSYMTTPPTGSETGLVGYWDFIEGSGNTVNDLSGNGNHGAITGATWAAGTGNTYELDLTDFNDIDDFNGYEKTEIADFPGFSLSVQVDYVEPSSNFRSVSLSPTNVKRVITRVGHEAEKDLVDTLIISSGI